MKKVKDMTDEEIELEFDRQYKRDYLLERERREKEFKQKIIIARITLLIIAVILIVSALTKKVIADKNNDGFYEPTIVFRWNASKYED